MTTSMAIDDRLTCDLIAARELMLETGEDFIPMWMSADLLNDEPAVS